MPYYSVVLEFDYDDSQTASILENVFEPLSDNFHVAMFANINIDEDVLFSMYSAIDSVTSQWDPFMITPDTEAYSNRAGFIGVPMDRRRLLRDIREGIASEYARFYDEDQAAWRSPHATLWECKAPYEYSDAVEEWEKNYGYGSRRFRLRVIGLKVVENQGNVVFKEVKVFYFGEERTYDQDQEDYEYGASERHDGYG